MGCLRCSLRGYCSPKSICRFANSGVRASREGTWHRDHADRRTVAARRRLLIYSAPLTAAALLIIVKLISVVIAGNSAVSSFAHGDGQAVKVDAAVSVWQTWCNQRMAPFTAGVAAVLATGSRKLTRNSPPRWPVAESGRSCPERVNLELVRETQGDRAAAAKDRARADQRYLSAQAVVTARRRESASPTTSDSDPQRLAIRRDTAARLQAKRSALNAPTAAVPPPAPPAAIPPPPPLLRLPPRSAGKIWPRADLIRAGRSGRQVAPTVARRGRRSADGSVAVSSCCGCHVKRHELRLTYSSRKFFFGGGQSLDPICSCALSVAAFSAARVRCIVVLVQQREVVNYVQQQRNGKPIDRAGYD